MQYWRTCVIAIDWDGEEMVVREGVLVRNERRIPYGRVQNVDFARNPLHRLFGVTALRLETASGGSPRRP